MEAPSDFSGGCACGGVRYDCSSAPAAMVNCHCRDCQRAGGGADYVGIRAGSLDDPGWFRATVDVWTASAQPWHVLSEHTTKYPRNRSR